MVPETKKVNTMDDILLFLVNHCSFLYREHGFRFLNSLCSDSFGNAFVILGKEHLQLRFIRDRSQLFLDLQYVSKKQTKTKCKWHSFDIVRQLISGNADHSALLDSENADFLRSHFAEIEGIFRPKTFLRVEPKLSELERLRAKRLFGK